MLLGRKTLLSASAAAAVLSLAASAEAVVFSQYYEGTSGSNRALEIWNPGATTIDLAVTPLTIDNFSNAATTPSSTYTLSTGLLGPGAVVVISNTDTTGDAALAAAGITSIDTGSAAVNFNGNDALRLRVGGVDQDIIGQIGPPDPGAAGWNGNGVSTVNQNIELISNQLTVGDLNGADAYDPSARFQTRAPADVTAASFAGFGQAPIPEPSSLAVLGLGGLLLMRRRA
jgi:uncharacterized protein